MKRNSKKAKKLRKLILVCVLSAILLTVSTYAWFIGLQTVTVKPFEINIATTDGLALSLDGLEWSTDLDVTTANQYDGHTNQWLTETKDDTDEPLSKGLIPVSSVGDVDVKSSRMKLYEKGSLTAKDGGYRLLTSQVKNCTDEDGEVYATEADGYVAFDLFIRNMSGEAYYSDNNVLNEEAIYLTYDSDVTVGTSGVENTGIENSVRVAFAQIGRVQNKQYTEADVSKVTGITCTDDEANGVTGICRLAQIWEPNDTDHIDNAISFYNTSCTERTGSATGFTYAAKAEDSGLCGEIESGKAYPTYAISRAIEIDDYVDVYDGASFNKYSTNTVEPANYEAYLTAKAAEDYDPADHKLVAVDTFTETERGIAANTDTPVGAKRNVFMTLAPNSITKVRVYVYIEGQDVDNYDFAQLGKSIQVNFGFTKERYTTDDYTDEPVTIIPGAENTKIVEYTATGDITEVTNAVWTTNDEGKTYFTTLKVNNAFEFKDGNKKMKATYLPDTKTWQIVEDNA